MVNAAPGSILVRAIIASSIPRERPELSALVPISAKVLGSFTSIAMKTT